jgi:hypothetical protein
LVDLELLELVVVLEEVHLGRLSLGVRRCRCRRHHANLRRGGADQGRGTERERERDPPDSPEGGWEGRKRNLDFEEGSRLERRLLGLEVVTVWEEIFAIIGFEHAASPLHGRGSVTQGYYYLLG